ncbi:MAG: lipase family alpha/beta hydrolase [Oscillospiraceae bacterium]
MNAVLRFVNFLIIAFLLNCAHIFPFLGTAARLIVISVGIIWFLAYNISPTLRKYNSFRLKVMGDGAELLLMFFLTAIVSLPVLVMSIVRAVGGTLDIGVFIAYCVVLASGEAALFWNGIIRVYLTSSQLGMRYRVLGIILGWIPVANLVMLMIIYAKVRHECKTELELMKRDEQRAAQRVCDTKYPILLVHGVFFRDSKLLNYWGRVPAELEKNGARIFYGEQQSALSVADSAAELAQRIERLCKDNGFEKVNIIAHSKGGLDSRYAISKLGSSEYVASLTTINTPHRGCIFAEYLLGKAPEKFVLSLENTYNTAFKALGDPNPDFLAAVKNLTNGFCEEFNKEVPNAAGVYYQSFGSVSKNSKSGRFPLNVSYPLVKRFDGDNDGLVALTSTEWGERFTPVYPKGRRGITHADVIDLNREDIKGFDVREFYVGIVSDLKERGF